MESNTISYVVQEVIAQAEDVVTLRLSVPSGLPFSYKAGQFITIYFPETGHQEGKSYSLSSSPHESSICITVRDVGTFSHKLSTKKRGEVVTGSLPYGYFYSESDTSPLVLVCGGIGVAPLMSMIRFARHAHPERKMALLVANKTAPRIIFRNDLDELSRQSDGNLVVRYYLTQEVPRNGEIPGRIPLPDIMRWRESLGDAEVFMCGSIEFVRDYWRGLKQEGVPVDRMCTEAFF